MVCLFVPGVNFIIDFLSYPAFKLLDLFVTAKFPPNDESYLTIGLLGMAAQWAIIGFFIGLWRVFRHHDKRNA